MANNQEKNQMNYYSGRYIGDIRFYLEYITEDFLVEENLISDYDREFLSPLACGYILCESRDKDVMTTEYYLSEPPIKEALIKRRCRDEIFYLLVQGVDGGLTVETVIMDESMFEERVKLAEEEYPSLKRVKVKETDSQKKRRRKNTAYVHSLGISTNGCLPANDDSQCSLKDKETVCRRAMACIIMAELAVGFLEEEREYFEKNIIPTVKGMLKHFGVEECLNDREKSLLEAPTERRAMEISWTCEAYWALCWCLGLIDDIKDSCGECALDVAWNLLEECRTAEKFIEKCRLRDKSEIIDMEDLYLRYHWACHGWRTGFEGHRINPDVVIERRRGLEWVLSDAIDWRDGDIDMDC